MPKAPVTAEEIQQAVMTRITSRQYPPGTRLPSVRDLALELGANRNTVHKAYQLLAEHGLVESQPGGRKGFYVKEITGVLDQSRRDLVAYFYGQARNLVWQGLAAGLSAAEVHEQLINAVRAVYDANRINVAFYECNTHDSSEMGGYLSRALDVEIHCGVLDELTDPPAVAEHYDLIITTFHHLSEVSRTLEAAAEKIVGIDTRMTPETMLQIARLPRPEIGVVATLDNTAHMLKHILYSYYPDRTIQTTTIDDTDALRLLGRDCDHILATHTCAAQVEAVIGRVPDVIIDFQVDEQSIQFLRRRVHQVQTRKSEMSEFLAASSV